MRTHRYPSDVTDAQWPLIKPHIPIYPGGRPRKTDARDVVDAILYILWTVERTFAWLGRCRRLSKDREKSVRSSEAFIKLAMIHLMLNRIEPSGKDAEFAYRELA